MDNKSSSSGEEEEQGVSSDDSQLSSSSDQPSSSSEAPPPPPPPSSSSVAPSSSSAVRSSSSSVVSSSSSAVRSSSSSSYFTFTGGSLWGPNTEEFPTLQVQVPDVIACWNENPDIRDDNPCFTTTAGWWFGAKYAGGFAEVRREGLFMEFTEGVSLTSYSDGSSLIDPDGLRVRLTAKSEDGTLYGGSYIGFNFKAYSQTQDINSYGGYCITYSSDGPIIFKLGHDENIYDDGCTFDVTLPPSSTPRAVSLSFDNFVKPNWCNGATRPKPQAEKSTALTNAVGARFATEATNSSIPNVVNFTIHRLGWLNDGCSVQH